MKEYRLISFLILINFMVFFTVGALFLNYRSPIDYRVDSFLSSLTQPKASYYLDFSVLSKKHNNINIIVYNNGEKIRDICYEIYTKGLRLVDKTCNDITVIFDEHSLSSLMAASFHPQEIILSELLTGHIKISGLGVEDLLSMKF